MKILLYGLNFYPELTGIGKFSGEMAAYLVEHGHEVRVITAPPYYPEWQIHTGYRSACYQREAWHRVKIIRCPLWIPQKKSGFARVLHLLSFALSSFPAALSQLFWKPDLVCAVAPALTSAPFAWLVARLSGAAAWLHLQDLEVDAAMGLGLVQAGFGMRLIYSLEQWILNRFDHISTISQSMAQRVQAKGVKPGKISLLPNWVDTDQIYPLEFSEFRSDLQISATACVVLYSGNMGEKQGLEILIDAAARLKDSPHIQFVLCGEGTQRAALEKQGSGLPNLHFLPLQPVELLNQLLNLADIHVLTQRKGAAGLVMPSKLSGMLASGKAVLVTAEPDTELGIVADRVGVLVPPEDSNALSRAIQDLASNPSKRAELGQKGRIWVEQNVSAQVLLGHLSSDLLVYN